MTDIQFLLIAILADARIFLLQYLPLLKRHKKTTTPQGRFLQQSLASIGPGAIVAHIVVSLGSEIEPDRLAATLLPILSGLLCVVIGRKVGKGNIAVATLSGVALYAGVAAVLLGYFSLYLIYLQFF